MMQQNCDVRFFVLENQLEVLQPAVFFNNLHFIGFMFSFVAVIRRYRFDLISVAAMLLLFVL